MQNESFFQNGPVLTNQFADDLPLISLLQRYMPDAIYTALEPDLHRLGARVLSEFEPLAVQAEAEEPQLIQYDPWGRRIDEIKVSPGWDALHACAAEEGLIATGYERQHGMLSRLHQFARLYLYAPSSAFYFCPLAMTDGAARLIELYGDADLKTKAFRHLTSRQPEDFWTSGQWMTERPGGSDVANTETQAVLTEDGQYHLYGHKWFTSATTSQMAMTLARVRDHAGNTLSGSKGLSLFYLETRTPDGQLNGIKIDRLKDKLGSRALPTAELTLDGCQAKLIGQPGEGVKLMSSLFNITRIYNAIAAVSYMRRCLALARDYAYRRSAFGRRLMDLPLHAETLAQLEVRLRGSLSLTTSVSLLLGREECGEASDDEAKVLRLMTPVVKLFTAKEAITLVSEVIECMGGAGYIEDTRIPKWLRDVQVLSIWEGTTNVLSLDMLRSFAKEDTYPAFKNLISSRLEQSRHQATTDYQTQIRQALKALTSFIDRMLASDRETTEASAREAAFSIARIYTATELLLHANWSLGNGHDPLALPTLRRWCSQRLTPDSFYENFAGTESQALAMGQANPKVSERTVTRA